MSEKHFDEMTDDEIRELAGAAQLHYRIVPDCPPGTIRLPDHCACGNTWPCTIGEFLSDGPSLPELDAYGGYAAEAHDTSVTISAAIRLHPLRKVDSEAGFFNGDLQQYAESFCKWMTAPLSEFADRRGGDCFVAVVLQRGDETAGMEYRDGAFVQPEAPGGPS